MSSQWVDADGGQWRFSTVTRTWRKLVNGTWVITPLPSGGLRKVGAGLDTTDVIIVETMGPPGPPGPPGPAYMAVSQVLPAQLQDGVNATFTLPATADLTKSIQVFRNGLLEVPGQGYLVTPPDSSVTFTTPPLGDDVLTVIYQQAQ